MTNQQKPTGPLASHLLHLFLNIEDKLESILNEFLNAAKLRYCTEWHNQDSSQIWFVEMLIHIGREEGNIAKCKIFYIYAVSEVVVEEWDKGDANY